MYPKIKKFLVVLLMFDSVLGESSIMLKLFTEIGMDNPFEINMNNTSETPLIADCPIEVLIHGFQGNSNQSWLASMKNTLLDSGCNNVIIVDWAQLASGPYFIAVLHVPPTGKYIGEVLISLVERQDDRLKNIRIRGFSLGGHVAGFIGKTIINETGSKVGRITGMDPAGPLYLGVSSTRRLDKDDAMFTDIIHTDGREYGHYNPLGHVDFYPNGGFYQSCSYNPFDIDSCSHNRAHEYFTESIQTDQFISTYCDSYSHFIQGKCNDGNKVSMGYQLDTNAKHGKYYLKTNSNSPYARGDNGAIV